MSGWRDVGPNFDKDSASPEDHKKFENLQALFSVWSDGEVLDLLGRNLNELVSWWNQHKKIPKSPCWILFRTKRVPNASILENSWTPFGCGIKQFKAAQIQV